MESSFRLQKVGERRYLLDVRGQVCPYPELLTLRAVKSLSSGDILEVITDNPPSVRDAPLTLKERGYKVDEPTSLEKGGWKLTVKL
jgi:tRNA 2-thiouridine synthesizing protein A